MLLLLLLHIVERYFSCLVPFGQNLWDVIVTRKRLMEFCELPFSTTIYVRVRRTRVACVNSIVMGGWLAKSEQERRRGRGSPELWQCAEHSREPHITMHPAAASGQQLSVVHRCCGAPMRCAIVQRCVSECVFVRAAGEPTHMGNVSRLCNTIGGLAVCDVRICLENLNGSVIIWPCKRVQTQSPEKTHTYKSEQLKCNSAMEDFSTDISY